MGERRNEGRDRVVVCDAFDMKGCELGDEVGVGVRIVERGLDCHCFGDVGASATSELI